MCEEKELKMDFKVLDLPIIEVGKMKGRIEMVGVGTIESSV